jgi:YHS domain-containing protein
MGGMAHDESGQSKYADVLAKLSPADRELAEKQKVCPVSGEPLGAMGTPYKVTVEGQDVMLCCSGCEAKIKANPTEYLAKLKQ